MIISITCRHGTEAQISRSDIGQELATLSKFVPVITRTQVVFSKETHHKCSGDLVTCHLSVHIPNRRPIDIYEHQSTELQAFDRARERAIKQITRSSTSSRHSRYPHLVTENLEQAS
ncbi:MAG: hypothetical protein JKY93_12240 [Gammaproteobacteria bacterium]|nr:hypothetical protein [Gammaproteobacteria bacterium]